MRGKISSRYKSVTGCVKPGTCKQYQDAQHRRGNFSTMPHFKTACKNRYRNILNLLMMEAIGYDDDPIYV